MGSVGIGNSKAKSLAPLGFLTIVESSSQGLFGGYLIVSPTGRPLEFHCTAPVKANRAQEILYGPTLEPFLYGEQIGRSLVSHSKLEPSLLLTNSRPVLALRELIETPVVLVYSVDDGPVNDGRDDDGSEEEMGSEHTDDPAAPEATIVKVNQRVVELPADDGDTIRRQLIEIGKGLDLMEPFDRIDQAIREAQQVGQAARDAA